MSSDGEEYRAAQSIVAATWPGHDIKGGSGYIVAQKLLNQ